jgi:hypothetical protein
MVEESVPEATPAELIDRYATGLLPHETGGWCHPFSHVGINVDHKKRVDLGVLRGADHDGLGEQTPF